MTLPKITVLHLLAISLAVNVALGLFVGYSLLHPEPMREPAQAISTRPSAALPPTYADEAAPSLKPVASQPARPTARASATEASMPAYVVNSLSGGSSTGSVPLSAPATAGASVDTPARVPGNSFSFRGMTVAVEGQTPAENGGAPGLLVSVEQTPLTPNSALNSPQSATQPPATTTATPSQTPANNNNGGTLTDADQAQPAASPSSRYEQELFRARWGSDTYSAVQAEALRAKNAQQ